VSAKVTGLRRASPGVVLVEVDGVAWREVPDEVVVRSRLAVGVELDRPFLRRLRAELRGAEALLVAGRALRRRDVSRQGVAERLERAGVAPAAKRRALDALRDAGAVDDARLARARAASLAERGWGDSAIVARLEAQGIPEAEAHAALETLPPENERAGRVAARIGDPRKVWALLARRGFDPETAQAVVERLDESRDGGLG
jgi:SOS response regulatory protein OraA/RecX